MLWVQQLTYLPSIIWLGSGHQHCSYSWNCWELTVSCYKVGQWEEDLNLSCWFVIVYRTQLKFLLYQNIEYKNTKTSCYVVSCKLHWATRHLLTKQCLYLQIKLLQLNLMLFQRDGAKHIFSGLLVKANTVKLQTCWSWIRSWHRGAACRDTCGGVGM